MRGLVVQPRAVDRQVRNSAVGGSRPRAGGIKPGINGAHRLTHRKGPGCGDDLAVESRFGSLIRALAPVRRAAEHIHLPAKITDEQRTGRVLEHIGVEFLRTANARLDRKSTRPNSSHANISY